MRRQKNHVPSENNCENASDSDVVLLEGNSEFLMANIKRKFESRRKYQDTWTAIHHWAENVVEYGKICVVKCRVCSRIDGKDKILKPKLDGLWKHAGRKKVEVDI